MEKATKKVTKHKIPMELYIHIPFCVRKCLYCDFLSFAAGEETKEDYVKTLTEEIRAMGAYYAEGGSHRAHGSYEVISVFLGGGTPSALMAEQTRRIMDVVKDSFQLSENAEVTMEVNPGTIDREKLKTYQACGINRLSIGLQSAEDAELMLLGRVHTFQVFLNGYQLAREAGFDNINIDLMAALPGQTEVSFQKSLRAVTALSPEHISAYSLIIEEGTPFYERYGREKEGQSAAGEAAPSLPDEETDRGMYHFTKQFLKAEGYERYEISNYAKPGRECRHNIGYWIGREYLGLGLGASSYMGGERFSNESDLNEYLAFGSRDFIERTHHREREVLTERERMEEFMFLGLRLTEGVGEGEFERRFGIAMAAVYGKVLKQSEEEGLLMRSEAAGSDKEETYWRLTEYGTDVSNYVLGKFLLDPITQEFGPNMTD